MVNGWWLVDEGFRAGSLCCACAWRAMVHSIYEWQTAPSRTQGRKSAARWGSRVPFPAAGGGLHGHPLSRRFLRAVFTRLGKSANTHTRPQECVGGGGYRPCWFTFTGTRTGVVHVEVQERNMDEHLCKCDTVRGRARSERPVMLCGWCRVGRLTSR